ncbi:AtpZ/AtpI family protein [Candidatus Uhrbacteria bacterium]|nr:AtpZ/AtpI family protein [Candidatus Uhrbacteria bacterium]
MSSPCRSPSSSDQTYYRFALRALGDFGATLAVPAVLAAFAGIWLDRWLGTAPWLLAVCLALALGLTWRMVVKKAHAYAEAFDRIGTKTDPPDRHPV